MKSIDYKELVLKSCSTKELFDKGIFILDNLDFQALPLEYTLIKELGTHDLEKILLVNGAKIGRFSLARNLEKALHAGLLSEIYSELNKKKGIHIHKNDICSAICNFQIIVKNSYFSINKWLVDLSLPFKINPTIQPKFCTHCFIPYPSEKEIPEDLLCSREYRKGYNCRQVYQSEFINKLVELSQSMENELFDLLTNESDFNERLQKFKINLEVITKKIAKKIYEKRDLIKKLDFSFDNFVQRKKVPVDKRFIKEFDILVKKEMIDANMINKAIKKLGLSHYQARIFKKELLNKFHPAISIVTEGNCEYFKEVPPRYSTEKLDGVTNLGLQN